MEWQATAAALGGLIGQFFKAQPNIATWKPQVVMLVVGTFVYVAFNPPLEDGWAFLRYAIQAVLAGASVNGVASLIGLSPALKTQEVPK